MLMKGRKLMVRKLGPTKPSTVRWNLIQGRFKVGSMSFTELRNFVVRSAPMPVAKRAAKAKRASQLVGMCAKADWATITRSRASV